MQETGDQPYPPETDSERFARTALNSVDATDRQSAAVQKTKNRVTLDELLAKITDQQYINPALIPHMTICVVLTENGYAIVGTSTPGDEQNFDAELGKKFAFEDCVRQMWRLEAYLLRERMSL